MTGIFAESPASPHCQMPSAEPPARAEAARTPRRVVSIDGLRALAILLVILHHYTPWVLQNTGPAARAVNEAAKWAGTGVDLFFVLSGFLITGILVDSKGSSHYFARFYWRRSLRIFPAYYAFLAPLLLFPGLFTGIARPWFVFYLRNWHGSDLASDGTLGHLWSLAVEEQFYIGWSIVVFLVGTRWLPHITVALITLAPMVRGAMGWWGYAGYQIIRVTPARMDSLLLGALVALAVRSSWKDKLPAAAKIGTCIGAGGVFVVCAFTGPLNVENRIIQVAVPLLVPLLYASILAWCLETRSPILTNPFFRSIARYSYAIYLWHLLVGRLVFRMFEEMGRPALFIPAAFAAVYIVAVLSWRFIEAPTLGLKDRVFRNETS